MGSLVARLVRIRTASVASGRHLNQWKRMTSNCENDELLRVLACLHLFLLISIFIYNTLLYISKQVSLTVLTRTDSTNEGY